MKNYRDGDKNPNWKGGTFLSGGYRILCSRGHHIAYSNGYVPEHTLIAEAVLGKPMPKKAEIHHFDGNRSNNSKNNLVICNDRAYHMLLHMRTTALRECGHAGWRKCYFCKKYDDPNNMYIGPPTKHGPSGQSRHRTCYNKYRVKRHALIKKQKEV